MTLRGGRLATKIHVRMHLLAPSIPRRSREHLTGFDSDDLAARWIECQLLIRIDDSWMEFPQSSYLRRTAAVLEILKGEP